ncbi:MAG: type II secretion system F family protein [Gaiellaceae bacterium]
MILLIALLFVAVAVVALARAFTVGRTRRRERLAQIGTYGFMPTAPLSAPAGDGRHEQLDRLATRLGNWLASRLDPERVTEMRRTLYAAGIYNTSARQFFGYRALATIALLIAWIWLSIVGGASAPAALLGIAAAGVIGWVGPSFVVKRRAAARLDQVDYELPELVDLLVTAVEGGLAFTAALQLASRSFEGPLGEELRIALNEQQMGLTATQALTNMLGRIDTPAMRAFVQALVQGENLGVSTGKILRDIAHEMRGRRRSAAEERAHKAAVKIIFPIVFLIFPSLFILILGAAYTTLSHAFTGG